MKLPTFSLISGLLLMIGCSKPADTVQRSAPTALSAEVRTAASQRGKAIAVEAFGLLSSNLQNAIQSGGISNALPFCSAAALPLTTSLAQKHGVQLRRITHKPRNPADRADAVEKEILNVIAAALATSGATNPPPPLVTNLAAGQVTFFAPILLSHDLCLKCHGEPGTDISAEALALIQKLYPQDEATGFKRGQLRGLWRIDFPLAALDSGSSSTTSSSGK